MGEQLTLENLLKAVTIMPEEVESWYYGDALHSGLDGANPDFKNPLPAPQVSHLDILVRLKPPQAVAPLTPNPLTRVSFDVLRATLFH
jgi:hypothetical protein